MKTQVAKIGFKITTPYFFLIFISVGGSVLLILPLVISLDEVDPTGENSHSGITSVARTLVVSRGPLNTSEEGHLMNEPHSESSSGSVKPFQGARWDALPDLLRRDLVITGIVSIGIYIYLKDFRVTWHMPIWKCSRYIYQIGW